MTAPFPVPDDNADMYGMGQVGGTIIGIPKGSPHPEDAWLLVSWMATDTDTAGLHGQHRAERADDVRALDSPDLDITPQFQTFLDILTADGSHYKETSAIGPG
jgi:multiple sugar transport system substrate-binding protein